MQRPNDNLIAQVQVERGILQRTYLDGKGKRYDVFRADGVYDSRRKKRLASKTFRGTGALAAARSHRSAQSTALAKGETNATTAKVTVRDAAWCFLEAAANGSLRNKDGQRYKPTVLRAYESKLRLFILPTFGTMNLTDLTTADVQAWIDTLEGRASTVRNALMPLRVIYRVAIRRGYAVKSANPTEGLELPANDEVERDRTASVEEAEALIAALPRPVDRALWGMALYTGLRRGELMSLRWSDIDFAARKVTVSRSYDAGSKTFGTPKTKRGSRTTWLPAPLLPLLLAIRQPVSDELVFPSRNDPAKPFVAQSLLNRSLTAWARAGQEPIGLHECRHTCASWMIHAGLNVKQVSTYLGHASVTITLDRYGHLWDEGELATIGLLDAFLAKRDADEAAA